MNRSDLVAAIADRIGDKKMARQAVDALIEAITDAVARGEKVAVTGLGTFERAVRASTESERTVAGVAVPKFEPTKGFSVLVDEAKHLGEQAIAVAAAALADGKKADKIVRVAMKAQTKAEKKYGDKARPAAMPDVTLVPPVSDVATESTPATGRKGTRRAGPRKATAPATTVGAEAVTVVSEPDEAAEAQAAPRKRASAKQAPVKRTAAKQATAKRTAAKQATAKRTTAKQATAKRTTAKRTPAKQAPGDQTSTDQASADESSTEQAPAKKSTAKRSSAKKSTASDGAAPAKKSTATKRTTAKRATPAKRATTAKRATPAKRAVPTADQEGSVTAPPASQDDSPAGTTSAQDSSAQDASAQDASAQDASAQQDTQTEQDTPQQDATPSQT